MRNTYQKGRKGEDYAVRLLQKKGYQVLARNFRSRTGEVDIVCEAGELIVFIEVKSWRSLPGEALEVSIGTGKQQRIIRTARYFLLQNPRLQERGIRFDVVLVNPSAGTVRHIEGAFEASCPE